MTENSKICQIIDKYGEDWEAYMDMNYPDIFRIRATQYMDKDIVHERLDECPYMLFKYGIGANFSDSVVQEARGIIINTETKEVVAWPFRKFGNYTDSYADTIDWKTASVQEKIDGSLILLWWDEYLHRWSWSTSGVIYAEFSSLPENIAMIYNYKELISKAEEFSMISALMEYGKLDKDITYMFELTSPYNRVVIPYSEIHLTQIGARNKRTGKEFEPKLPGVPKPDRWPLGSLEDCVTILSEDDFNKNWDHEGFVVVDESFHRNKVKSFLYVLIHHAFDFQSRKAAELFVKMIYEGKLSSEKIPEDFQHIVFIVRYYEFRISEFFHNAEYVLTKARSIVNRYGFKEVHDFLKNSKYSAIVYKGIKTEEDKNKTVDEIIQEFRGTTEKVLLNYFPMYIDSAAKLLNK